jgi:hypothetical protein
MDHNKHQDKLTTQTLQDQLQCIINILIIPIFRYVAKLMPEVSRYREAHVYDKYENICQENYHIAQIMCLMSSR